MKTIIKDKIDTFNRCTTVGKICMVITLPIYLAFIIACLPLIIVGIGLSAWLD